MSEQTEPTAAEPKQEPVTSRNLVQFPIPEPFIIGGNIVPVAQFIGHIVETNPEQLTNNWDAVCASLNVRNAFVGEPGTLCKPIHRDDFLRFVKVLIKPARGYDMFRQIHVRNVNGTQTQIPGDVIATPINDLSRVIGAFVAATATAPKETN